MSNVNQQEMMDGDSGENQEEEEKEEDTENVARRVSTDESDSEAEEEHDEINLAELGKAGKEDDDEVEEKKAAFSTTNDGGKRGSAPDLQLAPPTTVPMRPRDNVATQPGVVWTRNARGRNSGGDGGGGDNGGNVVRRSDSETMRSSLRWRGGTDTSSLRDAPQPGDSQLARANIVTDVEPVQPVVHAEQVSEAVMTAPRRLRYMTFGVAVLVLVVVLLAVGLGVSLSNTGTENSHDDSCEENDSWTVLDYCRCNIDMNLTQDELAVLEKLKDRLRERNLWDPTHEPDYCSTRDMALKATSHYVSFGWDSEEEDYVLHRFNDSLIQRFILSLFYIQNEGPYWTVSVDHNWLRGKSVCNWFGVGCGIIERVTHLTLPHRNITGKLHPYLFRLPYLHFLDLSKNVRIQGTLPSEVGLLKRTIRELDLSDTRLNGTLPTDLGSLTRLKNLWLHETDISGPIPPEIGNAAALSSLTLFNTSIRGTLPDELANLSNLWHLDVQNTNLSGSLPEWLADFKFLEYLFLPGTNFSGNLPKGICGEGGENENPFGGGNGPGEYHHQDDDVDKGIHSEQHQNSYGHDKENIDIKVLVDCDVLGNCSCCMCNEELPWTLMERRNGQFGYKDSEVEMFDG